MVTILFTDFIGFANIAANMSPEGLVREIHNCYKRFDEIITRHGIEKIKTIGDSYMAVGGLPIPNETHATDVVNAAIEEIKAGYPCLVIFFQFHGGLCQQELSLERFGSGWHVRDDIA